MSEKPFAPLKDGNGDVVLTDPGLELGKAIARVLIDMHGPEFGDRMGEVFEARMAKMEAKGGDLALYAAATRRLFKGFDWRTLSITPSED
jgi:hypothetical protein